MPFFFRRLPSAKSSAGLSGSGSIIRFSPRRWALGLIARSICMPTASCRSPPRLPAAGDGSAPSIGHGGADLLIAATALEHELTVVTRNIRHFAPTGAAVENPFKD